MIELTSSNPAQVRKWLSQHPKQLTLLTQFEMELRLGRLSTSSTFSARNTNTHSSSSSSSSTQSTRYHDGCSSNIGGQDRRLVTQRTVELLRTLIGATKWKTAAQLLFLLRGLGRELYSAGGFREPAIGNVVRRVMCAVRDEVLAISNSSSHTNHHLSAKMENMNLKDSTTNANSTNNNRSSSLSLSTMLWAHTQHVKPSSTGLASKAVERERMRDRFGRAHRSDSVTSQTSQISEEKDWDLDDYYGRDFPPLFFQTHNELKERVMEAIQETISELDDLHKNINDQALNHIHAGEIILCYGRSKTVDLFLKAAAAKHRSFHVIIAEGAPHFSGHAMANSLASANIPTTVIHDAATFAIMARVNKVLLPAHAVLANGGLVAPSGCHMVALAARENAVPVVAITGMFKLCPQFPHEGQETLNDLVSPSSVMEYGEGISMMLNTEDDSDDFESDDDDTEAGPNDATSVGNSTSGLSLPKQEEKEDYFEGNPPIDSGPTLTEEDVELINPVHDYIPPDLIKLYVTNIGGFQPSYIYKLLAEYYHPDDWQSFE